MFSIWLLGIWIINGNICVSIDLPTIPSPLTITSDVYIPDAPTENLKMLLDRTSIIARIANAIYLQSGLEDVVEELLNFGQTKINDLVLSDFTSLETLAQKMSNLSGSWDLSTNELEEEVVVVLRKMCIGLKLTNKDNYLNTLKEYAKVIDFDLITEVYQMLTAHSDRLGNMEKNKLSSDSYKTAIYLEIRATELFFEETIRLLGKLKSMPNMPTTMKLLSETRRLDSTFECIYQMSKVYGLMVTDSAKQTIKSFSANLQQFDELKSTFESARQTSVMIKNLTESFLNPRKSTKKYSIGLPNGISDLETLTSDVWSKLEEETTPEKVSIEKSVDNLRLLLHISSYLKTIDYKLKPIESHEIYEFFFPLARYLEDSSPLKFDFTGFFKNLKTCISTSGSMKFANDENRRIKSKMDSVAKVFGDLDSLINRMDLKKMKSKMEDFVNRLGFTDKENKTSSVPEVERAIARLKENGFFNQFRGKIVELREGLNINETKLGEDVQEIVKSNVYVIFSDLTSAERAQKCILNCKDEYDKTALAIPVIQHVRNMRIGTLKQIESSILSLISAVNGLKSLNNDLAQLINKASPQLLLRSKMEFEKETVDILAVSVNSLQNAHDLMILRHSIEELKLAGPLIETEIEKIVDPTERAKIEKEWGNQTIDINDLETTIKKIDEFNRNLEMTSSPEYGNLFPEILEIPDVKTRMGEKIQAIKALIQLTGDDFVQKELKNSKKILNRLDRLDLQFSRHKMEISEAPRAFQDFFSFLAQFIYESSSESPIIVPSESKSPEKDIMVIVELSGAFLLVILVVLALFLRLYKMRKNRINKNNVRRWIRSQIYSNSFYAFVAHDSFLRSIRIAFHSQELNRRFDYLQFAKHRLPVKSLNHETSPKNVPPIHANIVTSSNGKQFYATQAPLTTGYSYIDTREDFWQMCVHYKIENIAMLCDRSEIEGVYFPVNENDLMRCGRFELKCVKVGCLNDHEDIIVREIQVVDISGEYKRTFIQHYNYKGWEQSKCPVNGEWEAAYDLMRELEKSQKPVVVHSLAGTGRAMSFIALHSVTESVKKDFQTTIGNELSKLRGARYHSINTISQTFWIQVAAAHKLNKDLGLEMEEELEKMFRVFQEVANDEGKILDDLKREGKKHIKSKP